ncbi:hypothetical protein O3G_MSEX006320 [Manduca sexta]|uniref:C2H2-type domain-containing protein n=1 Tax=Manduca sexta TaxID=7130 RepID=A0A921Z218_MANSE|nr:hypothetical protein O3G_MSEX006320 [Manduca sexta]KAG6449939.1 hypothetical protein O3G_MSEX006320 [Manduca sexta]
MMFDPPDYPYRELSEVYESNNFFNNESHQIITENKDMDVATTSNIQTQLYFNTNDSGRYFNVDNVFLQGIDDITIPGTEFYVVESENTLNYEPTLLDESTVNEFLLPPPEVIEKNTACEIINDVDNPASDSLALHSCFVCHETFTTDADLLDHTILLHASDNLDGNKNVSLPVFDEEPVQVVPCEDTNNNINFETEWLICRVCERVLSTALEVEPNEQLCCVNSSGKGSVLSRKLYSMYVCDACNGLFAEGDALDKHKLTCLAESNYEADITEESRNGNISQCTRTEVCFTCDKCSKQFSSTEDLKSHIVKCQIPEISSNAPRIYRNNTNNKMWNCGSCNQLFVTARELYRHKRGEDRPDGAPMTAYVCEECDKILGSMCALHTHKKMHKVIKPGYPCRICGRRFNQSGHLAIHMRMHTGERPYPCDLCPKAFKVKVERDDHRRTHTGERPFACAACPKTFTAAARLREHARIHTDQRPYRCEICGAAFRRPYARTVHTLIHTGEKPHECDVCGTAFRRSGDMWKHKRTLHGVQAN